jgi:acylphosphatase
MIEGNTVQEVGYRIFLLEKALENNIDRIFVRNLDKDRVELLLCDEEQKVGGFFEVVKNEKPKGAVVRNVKKQLYKGKMSIPSIDRYFQFLTLEQLSRGRKEVLKLPEFVGAAIQTVASSLKRMDEKLGSIDENLGNAMQRFGVFGEYAQKMDGKLTGMNEKLSGIDEKLTGANERLEKIATVPEKIDALPERIAKALSSSQKKT